MLYMLLHHPVIRKYVQEKPISLRNALVLYLCNSVQRSISIYSSGQNKVNVPFPFHFRATVLAFKRNAFYGTIDTCVPNNYFTHAIAVSTM